MIELRWVDGPSNVGAIESGLSIPHMSGTIKLQYRYWNVFLGLGNLIGLSHDSPWSVWKDVHFQKKEEQDETHR